MRHSVFGKKLSRSKNERSRLRCNLLRSLIIEDKIVTSRAKAKAIQNLIEKLISRAKLGTAAERQRAARLLTDKKALAKLWLQAQTRFAGRGSGFTRIIYLGQRRGDATQIVQLSFVDAPVETEKPVKAVQTVKEIKTKLETKPRIKSERKNKL